MVGTTILRKIECTCTPSNPCDRTATEGQPGFCAYCFNLDGPCPADGSMPMLVPPTPRKKTKK